MFNKSQKKELKIKMHFSLGKNTYTTMFYHQQCGYVHLPHCLMYYINMHVPVMTRSVLKMRRSWPSCSIPPLFTATSPSSPCPRPSKNLHFRSCLSGSVRKVMGKEQPLPNCQALRCLQGMIRSKIS